jgi:PAS domain-containing protein
MIFDNAMQGIETVNLETFICTKDGRQANLLLHTSQRTDMNGHPCGVLGIGQDITDKRHSEIEKSRIAQELQTIIDTANAPIFGIDSNVFVNEWNNKFATITGFSREEVLGKNLVEARFSFLAQEILFNHILTLV